MIKYGVHNDSRFSRKANVIICATDFQIVKRIFRKTIHWETSWFTGKCFDTGLQVDGRVYYRPLNYWVYDHEFFTRCQAPWEDTTSAKKFKELIWSVNYEFAKFKSAQIAYF